MPWGPKWRTAIPGTLAGVSVAARVSGHGSRHVPHTSQSCPPISMFGSHTNPARWQEQGLMCPFHRSENKEPLGIPRLGAHGCLEGRGWCFKPSEVQMNREAGAQPLLQPPGPEMAVVPVKDVVHGREQSWRAALQTRRCLTGELKGKGFRGQRLF